MTSSYPSEASSLLRAVVQASDRRSFMFLGRAERNGLSLGEELPAQFLVGYRFCQVVLDLATAPQEIIPEGTPP